MERSTHRSRTWREWVVLVVVIVIGVSIVQADDGGLWMPAAVLAALVGLGLWQRGRNRRTG